MPEPKLWDQTNWPPFDGLDNAEVAHYMELLWSKSLEDTARLIMHLERHIKIEREQVRGWRARAVGYERRLKSQRADTLKRIRKYLNEEIKHEPKRKKKASAVNGESQVLATGPED